MGERLVVLAGGVSSRMKKSIALTDGIDTLLLKDVASKSMLRLGNSNRPFLDYLLFNIREAGYSDIVIVIGSQDNSIREYYGNKDKGNKYNGLTISYAIQRIPSGRNKPLGTADALLMALRSRYDWTGKKFTVCNSDNIYSKSTLALLHKTPYENAMADYDRSFLQFSKDRIEKFAVTIKDDKNYLIDIIEKPSSMQVETIENKTGMVGVSMNLFRFDYNRIFPFLERTPLHPERDEKELPATVLKMIQEYPQTLYAHPVKEHVPDLTSMADVSNVKKYLHAVFSE